MTPRRRGRSRGPRSPTRAVLAGQLRRLIAIEEDLARRHGARVHPLPDGSVVVSLPEHGACDRSGGARGALCAGHAQRAARRRVRGVDRPGALFGLVGGRGGDRQRDAPPAGDAAGRHPARRRGRRPARRALRGPPRRHRALPARGAGRDRRRAPAAGQGDAVRRPRARDVDADQPLCRHGRRVGRHAGAGHRLGRRRKIAAAAGAGRVGAAPARSRRDPVRRRRFGRRRVALRDARPRHPAGGGNRRRRTAGSAAGEAGGARRPPRRSRGARAGHRVSGRDRRRAVCRRERRRQRGPAHGARQPSADGRRHAARLRRLADGRVRGPPGAAGARGSALGRSGNGELPRQRAAQPARPAAHGAGAGASRGGGAVPRDLDGAPPADHSPRAALAARQRAAGAAGAGGDRRRSARAAGRARRRQRVLSRGADPRDGGRPRRRAPRFGAGHGAGAARRRGARRQARAAGGGHLRRAVLPRRPGRAPGRRGGDRGGLGRAGAAGGARAGDARVDAGAGRRRRAGVCPRPHPRSGLRDAHRRGSAARPPAGGRLARAGRGRGRHRAGGALSPWRRAVARRPLVRAGGRAVA